MIAEPHMFMRSTVLDSTMVHCTRVCGWAPHPPPIYLASTWCHSCDRCSQVFPVFCHSSASVYYTERKPKNKKKRGGLGTRLHEYLISLCSAYEPCPYASSALQQFECGNHTHTHTHTHTQWWCCNVLRGGGSRETSSLHRIHAPGA